MNVDPGFGAADELVGGAIPEWLARRAYLTPDAPALFFGDRRWTFAQLDAAATVAARRLRAVLGADGSLAGSRGKGDQRGAGTSEGGRDGAWAFDFDREDDVSLNAVGPRVALLSANSDVFAVWVHAVAKAGAVVVPLNTRLTPSELAWQVADAGATVLIHDATYADAAAAAKDAVADIMRADHHGGVRLLDVSAAYDGPSSSRVPPADAAPGTSFPAAAPDGPAAGDGLRTRFFLNDVHSIVYTSGTTGKPKGAMLTYGNHWWSAVGSVLNLGLVPGDRWLACMPLFHVGGLSILLRSVIYGIPVIVQEKFDARAVHRAIDEQGVSLLSVVAAMLDRMLDERGHVPYPPSLRAVLLGGGPAPEALLRRAAALGMPVLQTYGLTETSSQVATLSPEDALRKLGSAGKPLFPTAVRIVARDENGRPRLAAPGQAGEIAVSGPSVTRGYWRRPLDTAEKLREGWLYTGDVGYMDTEGYLYVLDRRDDMFVSGGENVYPAEVEAALREHEAVAEAGVVGLPDPHWGRVPAAAVVLREGARVTEEELRQFCRARLAGYKVPTEFAFVRVLPRNAAGKLMRSKLRRVFRWTRARTGSGKGQHGEGGSGR